MSEIRIHKTMEHPHIVKLQHYFEDKENVYIILELCPNLSLNDMIKRRRRFTDIEVKCYVRQLLEATQYMHAQKVIH